ncbi:membrane dipeptidase [Tateyamaria sp. ANG-S1]|uniref:dipeptidase n=1 Tax=Tateyamaria sp. ANG-S1 TaxID=1577905 RepID=UPI0005805CD5|nr:membrane dipeptidase [Tateyamaria sp. ANG-S1]KIC51196.1 dipeptidase [Tateyamaria sp. ANG-S1]
MKRLAFALAISLALPATAQDITEAEMRAFHNSLFTLDSHIDIAGDFMTASLDPGGLNRAQVNLPGMRIGGLDGGFFIVYTRQSPNTDDGIAEMRAMAEARYRALERMFLAYPDQIALATTADEAEEIHASGRLVALMGMENAAGLGDSIDDVPMWADRGIRYVSLTHFGHNLFSGSSNPRPEYDDAPEDPGLSDLGSDLIAALNDHGIMVDISHVGKVSSMEAIELSRTPVIASHSTVKAVHDNARGLDDEQLRAIAEMGGVAQITAFRSYIAPVDEGLTAAIGELRDRLGLLNSADFSTASPATLEEYARERDSLRDEFPDVTLDQFLDHLDHAVEVAGIDHVGLSGDFDGGGGVDGWDAAADSFNVTRALLERGYSEEDIRKIWGENLLRVLRATEEAAVR